MNHLLAREQGAHGAPCAHRLDAAIGEARSARLPSLPPEIAARLMLWKTNFILRMCTTGCGGATKRPFFSHEAKDGMPTVEPHEHAISLPGPIEEAMSFFDAHTELYVGVWTILSITEMRELRENYEAASQTLVTPLAHRYLGMGHVEILAWNPIDRLVFRYPDGGSNGYDRRDNFKRVINLSSDDIRGLSVNLYDAIVFSEPM